MLEVKGLTKSFNGFSAISDISFSVDANSYVSLLGASGCGKSVLLRLVAGLLTPDSGAVCLNGHDVTLQPCNERQIGFVQQKYALFPHLNVYDNIAFGLRHRTVDPITDEAIVKRQVFEIIELVGLKGQEYKIPIRFCQEEKETKQVLGIQTTNRTDGSYSSPTDDRPCKFPPCDNRWSNDETRVDKNFYY